MKNFFFSLALVLTCSLLAQPRINAPLPLINDEPLAVLEDATGWCLSIDKQWMSAERTIPFRANSRDEDKYESKEGELGQDNFEELALYEVNYADSSLILLVKTIRDGQYKYPSTQKGWEKKFRIFYYLVTKSSWNRVRNLQNEGLVTLNLPLLDMGEIVTTKKKKFIDSFENSARIRKLNVRLVIQYQQQFQNIRFQLYTVHNVFQTVEGVRQDFKIRNRSLYGTDELFQFLYYECSLQQWLSFISMQQG